MEMLKMNNFNKYFKLNDGFYKALFNADAEKFNLLFDNYTIEDVNILDEFLYFNYGLKSVANNVMKLSETFTTDYKTHLAKLFYSNYFNYLIDVKDKLSINYNPLNSNYSKSTTTENNNNEVTENRETEKTDLISAFNVDDFTNDRQYKDINNNKVNNTGSKTSVNEYQSTNRVGSTLIRTELEFRKNNQFIDIMNDLIIDFLTSKVYE